MEDDGAEYGSRAALGRGVVLGDAPVHRDPAASNPANPRAQSAFDATDACFIHGDTASTLREIRAWLRETSRERCIAPDGLDLPVSGCVLRRVLRIGFGRSYHRGPRSGTILNRTCALRQHLFVMIVPLMCFGVPNTRVLATCISRAT